jgi:hypothetical protein
MAVILRIGKGQLGQAGESVRIVRGLTEPFDDMLPGNTGSLVKVVGDARGRAPGEQSCSEESKCPQRHTTAPQDQASQGPEDRDGHDKRHLRCDWQVAEVHPLDGYGKERRPD